MIDIIQSEEIKPIGGMLITLCTNINDQLNFGGYPSFSYKYASQDIFTCAALLEEELGYDRPGNEVNCLLELASELEKLFVLHFGTRPTTLTELTKIEDTIKY